MPYIPVITPDDISVNADCLRVITATEELLDVDIKVGHQLTRSFNW